MKLFKKYQPFTSLPMVAIAATGIGFAGCSGSDNPEPEPPVKPFPQDSQIELSAYSREAESRADEAPFENVYRNFGVYAYKTMADATRQDVMRSADNVPYEARIERYPSATDPERWHYDLTSDTRTQYLRYWDFSARRYDFLGIAPFRFANPADGTTVSIASAPYNARVDGHSIKIDGLRGNIYLANAIDWLSSAFSRTYDSSASPSTADIDLLDPSDDIAVAPSDLDDPVRMRFHHMLSALEIRAYSTTVSTRLKSITVQFVTVDPETKTATPLSAIHTVADYTNAGTPLAIADFTPAAADVMQSTLLTYTDDPSTSSDDVILNIVDDKSKRRQLSSLIGDILLEIPQDVSGLSLLITVTTDSNTSSGVFELTDGWLPDTHYTYYVIVSDHDFILLDVDVEKYGWVEGNDLDVEDPVVNW